MVWALHMLWLGEVRGIDQKVLCRTVHRMIRPSLNGSCYENCSTRERKALVTTKNVLGRSKVLLLERYIGRISHVDQSTHTWTSGLKCRLETLPYGQLSVTWRRGGQRWL